MVMVRYKVKVGWGGYTDILFMKEEISFCVKFIFFSPYNTNSVFLPKVLNFHYVIKILNKI